MTRGGRSFRLNLLCPKRAMLSCGHLTAKAQRCTPRSASTSAMTHVLPRTPGLNERRRLRVCVKL